MKTIPVINGWLLASLLLLAASSCNTKPGIPASVDGWAPIYASTDSVTKIEGISPRSVEDGGKIYIKDQVLYQVENGQGIHVIDYSNPASPQKIKFIRCYGARELSIMGNYLYTNNINDLVVLNIADINNVQLASRKPNMLRMVDEVPEASGYFECPDHTKGVIIGWEQKLLHSPRCRK